MWLHCSVGRMQKWRCKGQHPAAKQANCIQNGSMCMQSAQHGSHDLACGMKHAHVPAGLRCGPWQSAALSHPLLWRLCSALNELCLLANDGLVSLGRSTAAATAAVAAAAAVFISWHLTGHICAALGPGQHAAIRHHPTPYTCCTLKSSTAAAECTLAVQAVLQHCGCSLTSARGCLPAWSRSWVHPCRSLGFRSPQDWHLQ